MMLYTLLLVYLQIIVLPSYGIDFPVTLVSGFWKFPANHFDAKANKTMPTNKHSDQDYANWFKNNLLIQAPMVFLYNDNSTVATIETIRGALPTVYMYYPFENFTVYPIYQPHWVRKKHVPSVWLGMLWIEKVFHIQRIAKLNPFNSQWFCWDDAANAHYREKPPPPLMWPNLANLSTLPTSKFIASDSYGWGHGHSIAGTAFMYHISQVDNITRMYNESLNTCAQNKIVKTAGRHHVHWWECGSDQILLTHMVEEHPGLAHVIDVWYGTVIPKLGFENSSIYGYMARACGSK